MTEKKSASGTLLWPMSRLEILARASVIFWALLFLGTFWGHWHMPKAERILTGDLADTIRNLDDLQLHAKNLTAERDWNSLDTADKDKAYLTAIGQRFIMGEARYSPASNWLLWGAGLFYRPAGEMHEPHSLLRNAARIDDEGTAEILRMLQGQNSNRHAGEMLACWLKFALPVIGASLGVILAQFYKKRARHSKKPKPLRAALRRRDSKA